MFRRRSKETVESMSLVKNQRFMRKWGKCYEESFGVYFSFSSFFSGCSGSKASRSPELVKDAFGTTFSEVKKNFGWEMETDQMKEQIEPYYEDEIVVGYSIELEDVELLGTDASRVFLQFMGEEREQAELVLIYAEFPSEKEVDVAAKKLTKAFGEKKREMYCSLPGF